MSLINILSPETASKIAAGEVVERPSSVVKELVENSVDAGSKNITVEIVNGGLDLIKVTDDGVGIRNEELRLAFTPHATSKLKEINDIFKLHTLGFRGEALASVASVSKTLLKSKNVDEKDGMEIYIEGGEEKYVTFSAIDKGTMVEVRELLWNVPARLKFLKNPTKEATQVSDIMLRLALAYPDVSFTYVSNDKTIFRTYGNGDMVNVIRNVYSRKISENIMYFEHEYDTYKIYGYIGNEEISRGNRSQETLFVNGRYVISRQLAIAVERAFQSFIALSKFPFFILNIDIDPEAIDVNIHPQKAEIKFDDERLMFSSVFETVHFALREFYKDKMNFDEKKDEGGITDQGPFGEKLHQTESISFFDERKDNGNRDKGEKDLEAEDLRILYGDRMSGSGQYNHSSSGKNSERVSETGYGSDQAEDAEKYETESTGSQVSEVEIPIDLKSDRRTEKFQMPEIIGQFNRTYILAELNGSLFLFDQHACHEKINYEKYVREVNEGHVVVQPMMMPYVMDMTIEDYDIYTENKEVFKDAGFTVEDFGDRTIQIREVPYFLGKTDVRNFFPDIIDNLKNLGKGTTAEVRFYRLATAACKASVKANDELTLSEMKHLINELRFIDDPFTCPHGRPTVVRFTLADIEKLFRRRM